MNITYSVESMLACKDELEPFIEPHWMELGLDHQDVPVALDWGTYKKHDDEGRLHMVAVRDNGVLIGYHISLLTNMLHYKNTLHAVTDLYYLKPEYRKTKIGVQMFKFAETCFKAKGVTKIITGTKLHLNHSALFESLGHKSTEITFTKIL